MLRFGWFEDFKGADTLLIWGDTQGLMRFHQMLARLASTAEAHAAVQSIEDASGIHGATLELELGKDQLQVHDRPVGRSAVARFSAQRFAEFADKVGVLAGPERQIGHQYLDWPDMGNIQVIVSKGEYPEDFGATT